VSIFSSASRASVAVMVCPFCEERQARSVAVTGGYECRKCYKVFTKAAGAEMARKHDESLRPKRK